MVDEREAELTGRRLARYHRETGDEDAVTGGGRTPKGWTCFWCPVLEGTGRMGRVQAGIAKDGGRRRAPKNAMEMMPYDSRLVPTTTSWLPRKTSPMSPRTAIPAGKTAVITDVSGAGRSGAGEDWDRFEADAAAIDAEVTDDPVGLYMREIGRVELLTTAEERTLASEIETGQSP